MKYYLNLNTVRFGNPRYGNIGYILTCETTPRVNFRIIEVKDLSDEIKDIIEKDWINGEFGSKPDLYTWINRPFNDGKVNKNCKML